jgi:hypothetical protein
LPSRWNPAVGVTRRERDRDDEGQSREGSKAEWGISRAARGGSVVVAERFRRRSHKPSACGSKTLQWSISPP